MATATIVRLLEQDPAPITGLLPGWKIVSGSPSMTTWVKHTTADGTMISGVWAATPGTFHATYSNFEFVHLLEGEIAITPEDGDTVVVKAGDAFVVEPTFKGTWDIRKPVRKHFTARIK
jgi:uncharacterized protein